MKIIEYVFLYMNAHSICSKSITDMRYKDGKRNRIERHSNIRINRNQN